MLLDSAKIELQQATSDQARLMALIRIAVYRARRGEADMARSAISEIRSHPTSGQYSVAIAGANLAEGVLAFCALDFPGSSEKLKRAIAMATAVRENRLRRWCESWVAHIAFHFGRIEEMCELAKGVLASSDPNEHSTLSRVSSTLATACHDANRFDIARRWYDVARRHAVAEGDDVTIDATLHNIAANHIINLRLAAITGPIEGSELALAEMELQSSINYDRFKDPQSFRWMLPLLETHLALLRGDWASAEASLISWLASYASAAPRRVLAVAHADLAYCYAETGKLAEASEELGRFVSGLPPDAALDDLSIAYSQGAKAARLCSRETESKQFESLALDSVSRLREVQRRSERLLTEVPRPARYGPA